ncbi:MAG TPA: tetratricopeptide repeat protein, partial [Microlunatus sp.]|nr:tetratricopeptide repeat protein [Microlunatus sp.]
TDGEPVEVRDLTAVVPAPLVGRDAELTQLTRRPGRWLVSGMAGVGKTLLVATAAVELVRAGRADRALLVRLHGFRPGTRPSPTSVAEALLLSLGVPSSAVARADLTERGRLLVAELRRRRCVLVLDDAVESSDVSWLPAQESDQPWLLVTSRRRLGTPAGASTLELRPLAPADAADLLDVSVSGPDRSALRQLVALAGGLPLALVLTRARLRTHRGWSLTDHLAQLSELQQVHRLVPGVEESLALSYASLSGSAAGVLRLLGSLPVTGIREPLLAAAAGRSDLGPAVAELRDRYLVSDVGADRLGLHDLVAVFAGARGLEEDPPSSRRSALNRLLDAQAAAAGAAMAAVAPHEVHRQPALPDLPAGLDVADAAAALSWLDEERTDLLQAVGYAHRHTEAHDRPDHVVRMSMLLFRYLDLYGWYDDAERLHGWAAASTVEPELRARAQNVWGVTDWSAGRLGDAAPRLAAALEIYRQIGDQAGESRVLSNLAGVSRDRGDVPAALSHGRRALEIAVALDDRVDQVVAHTNLGVAHESLAQHAEALDHHREARELAREVGDRYGEARALGNLADILLTIGDHALAGRLQAECLEMSRELDHQPGIADSLNNLATLDSLAGRHQAAIAGHREALAVAETNDLDTGVIRRRLAESLDRARGG